ncbi:ribonuclease HIII [Amedibacillus sp. YH-ame10]
MSTKTVTMSTQEMYALKASLHNASVRKTPPYALYQVKTSDCVITAYESGKVVFQGEGADFYGSAHQDSSTPSTQKTTTKNVYPQCGSDEVGTGDYFGPVTVCACCVKEEDVNFLKELKIQDSKAIQDDYIMDIAPLLMERLTYSLLILDNATYNRIHPTNNMVAIKSKLHNQAYVHLQKKLGSLPSFCIIDQFVQKTSYYRYLSQEKEIVKDIHFETKAENKYLSVACGSVIARYAFLKAMEDMNQRYDFTFLKGAGAKVDENIRAFVERFGKEELQAVAKVHFANTTKAFL